MHLAGSRRIAHSLLDGSLPRLLFWAVTVTTVVTAEVSIAVVADVAVLPFDVVAAAAAAAAIAIGAAAEWLHCFFVVPVVVDVAAVAAAAAAVTQQCLASSIVTMTTTFAWFLPPHLSPRHPLDRPSKHFY